LNVVGRRDGAPCSLYVGPISPVSALHLAETSLNVRWGETGRDRFEEETERLQRVERILAKPVPECFDLGCLTERRPMPHQIQAIAALHAMSLRAILADDMGLGKTATSLWALQHYCRRILVICPASVKFNWQDEVRLTLGWVSVVIDGTKKDRTNIFTLLQGFILGNKFPEAEGRMVVIINYDLLRYLTDHQKDILAQWVRGQALICDESHYLKGDSQRTRLTRTLFATEHLPAGAQFRLLLTGTPIRNTVEDVYQQIECIHPSTWTSKTDFSNRHLIIVPKTVQVKGKKKTFLNVEGTRDLPGLNRILRTMMVRRKKEEVLNLPPMLTTKPKITLDDDAAMKRIYGAMKDYAILKMSELSDETTIFQPQARGAAQAAMRCEQIAMGFVGGIPEPLMEGLAPTLLKNAEKIKGRPKELMFPRHPKIIWLREAIKTLILTGHRVAVYSPFLGPLFWMHQTGMAQYLLHGSLNAAQRSEQIHVFRNGPPSVLGCQVSIAEGFNLTECQDVIFLGRAYSPAVNNQAATRCHRIGTKGTVNIQIPVVLKTIEVMIDRRLGAKEADATDVLKSVTIAEMRAAL
jgi:SNF2 family DNA or RNA helicase